MTAGDADDAPGGPDVEQVIWQLAVDAAGVGAFDWDLTTGVLRWDERLMTVFGVDRDEFGGTIEAFNALLHPDDVPRVDAALQHAIETCGEYVAEYRVLAASGRERWVAARGRAVPGEDGVAVRVIGAAFDTTASVDAEAKVARVLESMPTAFCHLDKEWRFVFVNSEAVRLLQIPRHELVGQVLWEAFPATRDSVFETHYRHAVASGESVAFDAYYPAPLDAWYEVRAWPNPDGLGVYFNDVTSKHRAQLQMQVVAERDELLARVTAELTGTLDPREALRRLARLLVPRIGSAAAASLVDTAALDGRYAVLRQVGSWQVRGGDDVRGRSTEGSIQFLSRDLMASLDHDRVVTEVTDPALRSALIAEALPDVTAPVVALPLRGRERLVGVVVVAAPEDPGGFTAEHLDTLSAIASRAGLAIDNARLFAEQRDLAEGLQRSLLSQAPHPDGLEVAVCYEAAAQTAQVGGDWYDAFVLESGDTVLVVGDVVGHDTEAAAAMGQMRSLLRGIAVHDEEGPADLLRGVDRVLDRLGAETTATALVARISARPDAEGNRSVRWSSAGHPAPMVVTPDGCRLLAGGTPDLLLGLDPVTERTESTMTLPHGAVLLMYTDGLVERRGEDLDTGFARLCSTAGDLGEPPENGLSWWCDGLVARMVPEQRDDDVALVAVRVGNDDSVTNDERNRGREQGTALLLPAEPVSVGRARAAVRDVLAEEATRVVTTAGEVREVEDEAVLATSELVTNALVHAGTAVLLRVTAGPRGVRVEVEDGSAHSPVPRWHALTSATGRGLRLVDTLVDRWDVTRRPDGKTVWFQIGAPPGLDLVEGAEWADSSPTRQVVLREVPLLMHWAWQEHAASLLREYLLLSLEDDPDALEVHAAASDALDLLREQIPPPPAVEGGPDAILSIAEEDRVTVADLVTLRVPDRSVTSFEVLDRTLAAATKAARAGRLLGPPTQPEIEELRSWLCRQVAGQVAGTTEPQPWRASVEPRAVRRVVDEEACAHLMQGHEAALLTDEESVIVSVTPGALRLLGHAAAEELLGLPVLVVVPPRFHQAHIAGTTLHVTNGREVLLDVPLVVPVVHADGVERPLGLQVSAHRHGDGTYFMATFTPVDAAAT